MVDPRSAGAPTVLRVVLGKRLQDLREKALGHHAVEGGIEEVRRHAELKQPRDRACGERIPRNRVPRDQLTLIRRIDFGLVFGHHDLQGLKLIGRRNVQSGETSIHDLAKQPLGSFTLTEPLDAAFTDDNRVFHGVTPIEPLDPARPGHRDVLVVTFRRE